MHEWLEALQKSAKTTAPGAAAEELRRSETEFGIPLPGELGDLYSVLNGGTFEGEVVLFPLTAEGERPSVQEKTRKMLVGLPVAGVWRFGLKGPHRHLFAARKSAMIEQGDGGGPLPEWVQTLGDDDWLFGTWDEEKKDMRLYRALSQMLPVLVPPVEHEDFGDRTFARAIAAVEGALSELTSKEAEEDVQDLRYEYEEGQAPELQQPAVMAAERRVKSIKRPPTRKAVVKSEPPAKQTGEGLETPAVIAAERRVKHLTEQAASETEAASPRKKAAARTATRKSTEQAPAAGKAPVAAQKSAAKKAPEKKAAQKSAAKKAPAKKAASGKGAAKKGAAKKAPAKKAAAKKAPAKKAAAKKVPAQKSASNKSAAKKAPAKKGAAKKAPAKKAPAKKAPAKKAGARRG